MRSRPLAALVAACCCIVAADASAQSLSGARVARIDSYYERQPSPSDAPAAAPPVAAVAPAPAVEYALSPQADKGGGCGCRADYGKAADCCECGPWRLFPEMGDGWTADGFIAAGATANADNPASRFNGPVTFNDRDDVVLNQLYLSIGRDADTGGFGFAWGARVDLLYGSDYIFTQAIGLETKPNGDNRWNGSTTGLGNPDLYGLAAPQAYLDFGYDNWNFKLGHFYTIIGYEVVPASGNFFYSHAYTMQYGEPFTHTGGLLSWTGENMTAYGGLVNGWDKFDALSDKTAFLGGLAFTPDDERYSVTFAVISGEEDGAQQMVAPTPRTMYSLVFDYHISDQLQYVLQHDNGYQQDAFGPNAPNVDAEWYGINQYLFYTVNESWKLGGRFEWFRDDDGVRLANTFVRNGGLGQPAAGFAGNYYNITLGANWTPNSNLTVRPEVRWDWSDGNAVAPYDDFTKDSQFTGAVDAILVY